MILTAGAAGSQGGGVSLQYDSMCVGCITSFAATPSAGDPLPLTLGSATDTGSRIQNINSAAFPGLFGSGLTAGQTHQLGTITFSSIGAAGAFALQADVLGPTDDLLNLAGGVISGTSTFNFATINVAPVPEPGTLSLLGMGLGGLYMVGRRSSRKR